MKKTICYAAASAAFAFGAGVSNAQSLAMSYKLDVRAETTAPQPTAVSACAGFNWLTSLDCGRDLVARGREVASVAAPELPSLGAIAIEARARAASVRDAIVGTARAPDLNFKWGSRVRKAGEENDTHRFTDFNYETFMRTNGHKAVGVELHVPFQ